MSLIGGKGDRALNESPSANETVADEGIQPEEAQLVTNEEAMQEVKKTVDKVIRRNSVLR